MRKHSRGKQWTVEVEMWGAARARAVAEAERREQLRMTRVEVRAEEVRPWDLVRSQAQMWALALLLTEAGTWLWLWKRRQEQMWFMEAFWEMLAEMKAETVKAWAREQARQLAWAWVWAAEKETESMPARALEGLGLGPAQVQAWLRMWTLEEAWEQKTEKQKQKTPTRRVLSKPWVIHYHSFLEPDDNPPRDAWPRRQQGYWSLIQVITPIARLPPEFLQQIFLIIIDDANDSPLVLMRVCKYWYNIITGIWASLRLGTMSTNAITRKLKRAQWLLDVLVDTEVDRRHFTQSEDAYQAIFAAIRATSRWRSLIIVETFPAQADLPEHFVNRGLQQCSNPVMSRLRTFKIKYPCEMSPLLDHLLRILGNTASRELTTVTINSANVVSFLVPTFFSIFRSVTLLSLDTPGLRNPVDLLPHLNQLEAFTASHLPLPVYHDDVDLPFVHTLRRLTLRSVSIQWMSGRTFHILESCTILFPLHRHVLHTFRATLPTCKHLSFEGFPLDILSGVSAHKLTNLSVKCCSSYKPRGDRELALFSSRALQEGRLAPRILHISIEATNEAWKKAFAYMSNLEELVINNVQPSSLGVEALRSLVVLSGITATPGEWNTPVCPSLKRFGLRYHRWLRPSEHFDLIPVFISIIQSRQQSMFPMQSFRVWTRSDQDGPLELVEGSSVGSEGFERLKKDSAITGQNL